MFEITLEEGRYFCLFGIRYSWIPEFVVHVRAAGTDAPRERGHSYRDTRRVVGGIDRKDEATGRTERGC